jgi:hypothetical protein
VAAKTAPEKVSEILDRAVDHLTVDEICKAVYRVIGPRQRRNIHLILHRMGKEIETRAAGYRKKKGGKK